MARRTPEPIPDWRSSLPADLVAYAIRVAAERLLDPECLFDGTSNQTVREARHSVMRLLRCDKGYGLKQIGDWFKVNHTTVYAALRKTVKTSIHEDAKNTNHAQISGPLSRSNLREHDRPA